MTAVEEILELARWAPSGDNTQPWRFEIKGELDIIVHGFDTRSHCVYDLDGRPSQMALGALLENMRIAATGHGLRTEVARGAGASEEKPRFNVRFVPDPGLATSPLVPFIKARCVQRRALSTRPLTAEQKKSLEASVAPDHQIVFFETGGERWRVATLMFRNGRLRLTLPEAFEVHRSVIEWNAQFSEDRIPDQAIGVDLLTRKLMRWALQSWPRVRFLNTWLAGTLMPRLQLDLLPGIACAAHIGIVAKGVPRSIDDYVGAGGAMQRLWLEVTRLGLWLQPEMTPVIFSRYQREGLEFSSSASSQAQGARVASQLESLMGKGNAPRLTFLARVGTGNSPRARSTRLPLSRLIWTPGN